MNRITTDDENSIMFPLNTFYAKDGEVWVRGGGQYPDFEDVTLVQWIMDASSKHGLSFTAESPECLGDEVYDALQYGDETVEGIIALMHEAAVQAAEMRARLKLIEDLLGDHYNLDRLRQLLKADRDGRCVFTKCKLGDIVFVVGKKKIAEARVQEIYLDDMPELIYLVDFECDNSCDGCPFNSWSQSWEGEWECSGEYGDGSVKQSDFGKTVFLTREAAEDALKSAEATDVTDDGTGPESSVVGRNKSWIMDRFLREE